MRRLGQQRRFAVLLKELPAVLDDLLVLELKVGLLLAESHDLPQGHAECPHVRLVGKLALCAEKSTSRIDIAIYTWG